MYNNDQQELQCFIYRKTVVLLSVEGHFAHDPSGILIYLEKVFGFLVDPWSLQLVDHLPHGLLVRLDLRSEDTAW